MRHLILTLPILFGASPLWATPQAGDDLLMGNQKHDVYGFQLPEGVVKRLTAWKKKHGHDAVSSANWEGFYLKLHVADGLLYLDAVDVDSAKPQTFETVTAPMRQLFGKDGPIHARWFTGELEEYLGEPVGYTHVSGKARVYRIEGGRLVKTEERKVRR